MSKILISDDEQQLRMGIALSLRIDGYEVTETANGIDALQAVVNGKNAGFPFDLLVCDYQMPRMTGEELLIKLKELRASLPTLIITGYGEKQLLVRLLRAGCRDFIDKPFEPEALCRRAKEILADTADMSAETRLKEHFARIGERTLQTVHDLNNIIGGTMGYADQALEELEPDHPIRRRIEKLLATSGRAAEICRGLLASHRKVEESFRVATEINSLIARIGTLLQDLAPENVTVTAANIGHPVWLRADAERLQQALLNLGFNAFAAMSHGGVLSISVERKPASRPGLQKRKQPCLVLSVHNTGGGIPAEKTDRLFEEGFTSRPDGFGFGLSIVKNIVEYEHHGWITVHSEPGKGTLFSLFFPIE